MDEKNELEKQKDERHRRQLEIAEFAANDCRDTNTKKYRKLLMVHLLLKNFFKDKMEREMNKFKLVEKSYNQIKTDTGITDANEIVTKFLNRESTYSHLLNQVSENEKKIQDMKHRNEYLNKQLGQLNSGRGSTPLDKPENEERNEEISRA